MSTETSSGTERPARRTARIAPRAISSIIPIALFLLFQRLFLQGGGLGGAIKG